MAQLVVALDKLRLQFGACPQCAYSHSPSAKIMQTGGRRAYLHFPECSLFSAKIRKIVPITKEMAA
jgi:hypothetical protein